MRSLASAIIFIRRTREDGQRLPPSHRPPSLIHNCEGRALQDAGCAGNLGPILFIIAAFAIELVVKGAVARGRLAYLRSHWLDVLIVFVPFLRPLRILRVLRVLPFIARGAVGVRKILGEYNGVYVLFVGTLSVLMSAFLVLVFERGAGGKIQTFAGALWWAAQTVTTVGYGDVVPITTGGRVIAVLLMVIGITLFGVLTAGVAAYFVHDPNRNTQDEQAAKILARFDALEQRLDSLESHLDERNRKRDPEDQR
jgi:voltage-gated potassium channel